MATLYKVRSKTFNKFCSKFSGAKAHANPINNNHFLKQIFFCLNKELISFTAIIRGAIKKV